MKQPISISGFTLVRNASILGYPFKESVRSVIPLCDEFIINAGNSEDNTWELCQELKNEFPNKIKLFQTEWELEKQADGFQLKRQTDLALQACKGNWCFYIQADEAIHEKDYSRIQETVAQAHERREVEGVLFDYVHFYGDYRWAIEGRNWYRREVRCFKNGLGIEAFRDAQGFRIAGKRLKVIPSSARVFHYGYVRDSSSLKTKSQEMGKWWGDAPDKGNAKENAKKNAKKNDYRLIRHVGLYPFKGTHPAAMSERISKSNAFFDPEKAPRKWDKREIKNAITLAWEKLSGYRIAEFRNYDVV